MINFSSERLKKIFSKFSDQKIMVIGDLMLDQYIWGRISRISPEAPVPVVQVESDSFRLGGSANVVSNVQSLGAQVIPVGLIGKDNAGEQLIQLFKERGLPVDGLIVDDSRPTTLKTRIIAHNQHVVRMDRELCHPVPRSIEKKLFSYINENLRTVGGIILEDYNKGILMPHFIREIIRLANEKEIMVFVDPKFEHFFEYQNVTLFKPNRKEVMDRMGVRLESGEDLDILGEKLLNKLQCRALLITLGEEGMILFQSGKPSIQVPTRAVKVHDVSGAGDTVIAVIAVSMISGASPEEAATIANHAAGIVCGEVGIVPIHEESLFQDLIENSVR